jgi:hypothetical protein
MRGSGVRIPSAAPLHIRQFANLRGPYLARALTMYPLSARQPTRAQAHPQPRSANARESQAPRRQPRSALLTSDPSRAAHERRCEPAPTASGCALRCARRSVFAAASLGLSRNVLHGFSFLTLRGSAASGSCSRTTAFQTRRRSGSVQRTDRTFAGTWTTPQARNGPGKAFSGRSHLRIRRLRSPLLLVKKKEPQARTAAGLDQGMHKETT